MMLIGVFAIACTQYDEEPIVDDNTGLEEEEQEEDKKEDDVVLSLEDCDVLKSYVNYSVSPNFKLGVALQSTDYVTKGTIYEIANANFVEMTAGNQMKYNTIVGTDGSMNFSKVTDFISAASAAGMTIYGHTLCWHSQQTSTYLNGLVESVANDENDNATWVDMLLDGDFESGESACVIAGNEATYELITEDGNTYMKVSNSQIYTNSWESQIHFRIPDSEPALIDGDTYRLSFKVKSDKGSTVSGGQYQSTFGGYISNSSPSSFTTTTSWIQKTLDFVVPANTRAITFCIGDSIDNFYLDDCTLSAKDGSAAAMTWEWEDVLIDGDFENGQNSSIQAGNSAVYEIVEEADGNHILTLTNATALTNVWDAQILFVVPDECEAMSAGDTYRLEMRVKSDNGSTFNPVRFMEYVGKYMTNATPSTLATTTEWSDVTVDFVIPDAADQARVLGLCFGTIADKFYFDDCSLSKGTKVAGSSDGSSDSDDTESSESYEDKVCNIVAGAMESWIKGMMEACDGYVTAWDVVNEPMDDGDTSALKSGTWDSSANTFYWQDYMGKDYVRYAVKYARQYGGEDLVLFVNDYNLEAAWNGNAKCDGLINMIEYWESDGVTRIDGIGTQMHINLSQDEYYQGVIEDSVVSMFEKLAATGKLIKISELDMGISTTDSVMQTVDVTAEQHLAMAEFYEFIVTKYFEIIPPAQQYGITQWCMTDGAVGSTWRAGEPSGLWDEEYNRKEAYVGFARGLSSAK